MLLALCLIMSGRGLWSNAMVRFSEDEKKMYDTLFSDLPRNRARHLFDQGIWLTGNAGDMLTYEGALVSHLYSWPRARRGCFRKGSRSASAIPAT